MAQGEQPSWRRFVLEQANTTVFQPAPVDTVTAQAPFSADFHVAPSFDLLESLPPAAADKLRLLRQRSSDAHSLIPMFSDIQAANTSRQQAEHRLRQLQAPAGEGGHNLPDDDARCTMQQRLLATLTADALRLSELSEVRSAAWRETGHTLQAVEDWLKTGRPANTTLEVFEAPEPQLRKGESLLDGVERARHRGRELRADRARLEAAAYPAAEARAVAMAQIDALCERGALDTSGCVEHLEPFRFPTKQVSALIHNSNSPGAVVFVEMIDAEAVIAHLLRPQLVAAAETAIAADADEPNALSQAEREKRAAVISQDLLICEREEASLTWRAQAEGLAVEFRSDINPVALLGLKLITASREVASSETTPGYSWPWRR